MNVKGVGFLRRAVAEAHLALNERLGGGRICKRLSGILERNKRIAILSLFEITKTFIGYVTDSH
jgi:hypothetical protein